MLSRFAVLVTGLPSSASWQDLKVKSHNLPMTYFGFSCFFFLFDRSQSSYAMSNLMIPMSSIFIQDHMRRAGDVCFSQVFRDGRGMMTCESSGVICLKVEEYFHMLARGYVLLQRELYIGTIVNYLMWEENMKQPV